MRRLGLALLCCIASAAIAHSQEGGLAARKAPRTDLATIARDTYIYAYPLVTMEMMRRNMTNVIDPVGARAPMGQLVKQRRYADATSRDVKAPNFDTLHVTAWVDVGREPWILTVPSSNRYYVLSLFSGWSEVFAAPGTRTTNTGPHTYAITGPGWQGTLPRGVTELRSPTAIVWLLGRIQCTGTAADYKAVRAMSDAMRLAPLSTYGKRYSPSRNVVDPTIDMNTPLRHQVHGLSAAAYFALFANLLKSNPPAPADAAIVAKLATMGIVPGRSFRWDALEPAIQAALTQAAKPAQLEIATNFNAMSTRLNGWIFSTETGVYGTAYLNRATAAAMAFGANRPQDVIDATSETDPDGAFYNGSNRYVMHFDKGQLPPANAFWSITIYDDQHFFADNALDRYSVNSQSTLTRNADGSVDLYIQHDSPGQAKESNWLPAPAGKFVLTMRLYMPAINPPSILDGTWRIPGVTTMPTSPYGGHHGTRYFAPGAD